LFIFQAESRLVQSVDSGRPSSPPTEGRRPSSSSSASSSHDGGGGDGAETPEVTTDSGLDVTTTSENTPFASRPESELVLPEDAK
jgi:hypothetical protein